jgi:hypothetical protein
VTPFAFRRCGFFSRCEPPRGACGTSRHRRSSSVLVEGSVSSRCRFQLRVARLLTVKASAPSHHGAARRSLTGTYRRPPTSCAQRLRKPDRMCELLAPSVAPRIRRHGLLTRAPEHPVGWPLSSPTPLRVSATSRPPLRRIRRDRRRFRTTDNRESVRLPSDRPGPCGPGGLGRACCSRARASPRTLSLAAIPACLVKGGRVASSYPVTGKMRLTDFCNRRSPNEHPADCSIPGCALACLRLAPGACEITTEWSFA